MPTAPKKIDVNKKEHGFDDDYDYCDDDDDMNELKVYQ